MALQSLDQVLKSTQVSSLIVVANTATKGLLQEMAGVLGVGTAVTKSCHEFQLFNKLCLTGLSGVAYVAVYCYLALFCNGHNVKKRSTGPIIKSHQQAQLGVPYSEIQVELD